METKALAAAVKINFFGSRHWSGKKKVLYFFTGPIFSDDWREEKTPGVLRFVRAVLRQPIVFWKRASYLMHEGRFNAIRSSNPEHTAS